jgi:hypothetical protein
VPNLGSRARLASQRARELLSTSCMVFHYVKMAQSRFASTRCILHMYAVAFALASHAAITSTHEVHLSNTSIKSTDLSDTTKSAISSTLSILHSLGAVVQKCRSTDSRRPGALHHPMLCEARMQSRRLLSPVARPALRQLPQLDHRRQTSGSSLSGCLRCASPGV